MFKRHLAPYILKYAKEYPIIGIVGPRQSGKTTLSKALFPKYKYLSLENLNLRRAASEDPEGFLATHGSYLILDEVQHVPELFSHLQVNVDENQKPAQYVLTGSSQFLLVEKISQSLAGRIVTFKLFPFTYSELKNLPAAKKPEMVFQSYFPNRRKVSQESLYKLLLTGFYPRIYDKHLDSEKWYENYVFTYVERDVRSLLNVRNIRIFENFLLLCASRTGQLLDYSDLASALGVAVSTIKEWISILETSGIIFILKPFFQNYSKRVVKTPKLYFLDTGLLCHLLSIRTVEHLKTHPLVGWIFETFIVSECYKRFTNMGLTPNLYFWRDQQQNEIDLLIYDGRKCFPIEIKFSQSFHSDYKKTIEYWMELNANPAKEGLVIYCGEIRDANRPISAYPWYLL
jgi:uncharacterized protein